MLPKEDESIFRANNLLTMDAFLKPICLDMDSSSWGTWDGRIKLESSPQGLVAEFSEAGLYKYLFYTLIGPVDLKGAIFSVTLCFDEVAASSTRKVAFFNSLGDTWANAYESDDGDSGADLTYSCTDFIQAAAPGQKFKIGLVFSANAGSVTIKKAMLHLPK